MANGGAGGATRVAIVGPVEPYRSGIARHTTALARALQRKPGVRVKVMSFSRQYPALLFPGESDRASDAVVPSDLDVQLSIDSLNPLSWARTVREVLQFEPQLVLAPAWTFFLAPCFAWILHRLRRQGCRVVALVHNVADHDADALRRRLSAWQLRQADEYITHTRELARGISSVVPGACVHVQPHPVFDYPVPKGLLPRRAELELLMFGLVRAYKGLDVLLEALARVEKPSIHLSVVGELWKDAGDVRSRIAALGLEQKVELTARYVADAEAAEFFGRADVVMLPYHSVSGSGVLPLAFHYGKPVAVSDLPGLSELVGDGMTGWLLPVGDASAWANAIDQRISRPAALAMQEAVNKARQRLTFEAFADAILELTGRPAATGSSFT